MGGKFNHRLGPLDDRCNDCKHGMRSTWWDIRGFPAILYHIFVVLFVLRHKSSISKRPNSVSRCSQLGKEREKETHDYILPPSGLPSRTIVVFINEQHWHTAIRRWRNRSQIQQSSNVSSVQAARNLTGYILKHWVYSVDVEMTQNGWMWRQHADYYKPGYC